MPNVPESVSTQERQKAAHTCHPEHGPESEYAFDKKPGVYTPGFLPGVAVFTRLIKASTPFRRRRAADARAGFVNVALGPFRQNVQTQQALLSF
jgi:hypothetical protein